MKSAIVLTLHGGKSLEGHEHPVLHSVTSAAVATTKSPAMPDPFTLLVVQLVVIILAARLLGALFTRLGQPAVVGEIAAGIALGPSLLGALAPGLSSVLFSASSIGTLRMLSQIGVLLFMFVVGMELDVKQLRGRADTALVVSHASILFPYFLGVLVSLLIYVDFAPPGVPFLSFALFMGIAMSITASPVLARILAERGMSKTFLGAPGAERRLRPRHPLAPHLHDHGADGPDHDLRDGAAPVAFGSHVGPAADPRWSSSRASGVFGQSSLRRRESARSASNFPPV